VVGVPLVWRLDVMAARRTGASRYPGGAPKLLFAGNAAYVLDGQCSYTRLPHLLHQLPQIPAW
jgi:hypothetical protein